MKIAYKSEAPIRFNQCDPAGVMYFSESFVLAHQLIEDFMVVSGIGWASWFSHPKLAFPLVHASCDYRSPLKAGMKCSLHLAIDRLSLSTVTFITQAYMDVCENRNSFVVKTVHTAMDKVENQKAEFTKGIYQQLKIHA